VIPDYLDLAGDVTRAAKAKGADDCDCFIETGRELTIKVRSGEVESIERASFRGMGIRFFSKQRLGFAFTTDFSRASITDLVDQCRAFALAVTPDPEAGIPDAASHDTEDSGADDLEINDETIDGIPLEKKIEFALTSEGAAYDFDKRIKHTYSTAYGDQSGRIIIARMGCDPVFYDATSFDAFCGPVAEAGGEKRMGLWSADARYYADLEPAASIGQNAARRAVTMLGASTPTTRKAPVVFEPLTGCDVVADIFHGLEGQRVLRGMSFLKDKLGKRVGSRLATFVDDGRIPRRMGSRPFDVEGVPTRRIPAIAKGMLKAYFYDYRSARRAGASPTGNARRGFASIPDVAENNFYLIPGTTSRDDLVGAIKEGLLVTRMLGFGVNITTGDYSRGAEGLWLKDGKPSHPVSGITIASNLGDMLKGIDGVASDLRFFGRFGSPTFAIREMTIAGE
jgi:PmbA protein